MAPGSSGCISDPNRYELDCQRERVCVYNCANFLYNSDYHKIINHLHFTKKRKKKSLAFGPVSPVMVVHRLGTEVAGITKHRGGPNDLRTC